MQLRSYIEAIDLPTIYYIYYNYTMVSVRQMNLLPENASGNDTILPTSLYHIYQNICAITILVLKGCAEIKWPPRLIV